MKYIKYKIALTFAMLLVTYCAIGQNNWTYKEYAYSENILKITCDSGNIWIQPYTPHILKISVLKQSENEPDTSNSVILAPENITLNIVDKPDTIFINSQSTHLQIIKKSLKINFINNEAAQLSQNSFYFNSNNRGLVFSLKPNECIYGAGFRSIPLNRRGYKLDLYNKPQYDYRKEVENLNYSVPLVISSQHYAILFDNPQKGFFDIGKSNNNAMVMNAIGGSLTYYYICDSSFESIEQWYTLLTGRQPLPPRWAFGNLQSRMSYSSEAETRDIVNRTIKDDFPLDAIIIDLNWFGKFNGDIPGSSLMGNFTWNIDNWKTPKKMIADFAKIGVQTILVTEPYIIKESHNFNYIYNNGLGATDSLGKPYVIKDFYFGQALLLDIFKPQTQLWLWQQYKSLINIGVAGWWGDLGEPERHPANLFHVAGSANAVHNIYGHYWDKMLYNNYKAEYPNVRLFNLNRSGFAGSQRFGILPWTGDVSRSWEGLQAQLPSMLSMSMCGLAYIHSDLGGFTPSDNDEELYIRWLQFGTFSPIFRVHGDSKIPPEPIFHSEPTKNIVRKFIKLRYQMLPYNYTLAWENTTEGKPIIRPLYYNSSDTSFNNLSSQYFWGNAFLIAPITNKAQRKKAVYLPQGYWYNFWNDSQYAGNQIITTNVSIIEIPVYVKAGSFIPFTKTILNTAQYNSSELSIHYYNDSTISNSEYCMFNDDGITNESISKKQYELLNLEANNRENELIVNFSKSGYSFNNMPVNRTIELIIHGLLKKPISIMLGSKKASWKWDKLKKQAMCKFEWNMQPTTIRVTTN